MAHVVEGDDPSILPRIVDSPVNLAVWRRDVTPAVASAVRALLESPNPVDCDWHAPSTREIAECMGPTDPQSALGRAFEALALDVVRLSGVFAEVADVRHPRVRFARVEDDGCALFHADTLGLRLLCTYVGPGTQWLENTNVRRGQLGSLGRSATDANRAIVIDPSAIRSIPNWHVAVFKGRAWPGGADNALVHRSAPVRHRGEHRLRLCVDLPTARDC
ncbi:MAG: DUF1826 domain-containing protein [Chthoniobacterales bacterium]